jgi:hypothetical protein
MFVPGNGVRRLDDRPQREQVLARPSNEVARERIAEFRHKLHTGMLDGAAESLGKTGKVSELRLGDFS